MTAMSAAVSRYGRAVIVTAAMLGIAAAAALMIGLWIPGKAALAQVLLERAWDATRGGELEARPWPWADTSPVARLDVPDLDASWIVLAGASGRSLAFAPGQLRGSAAPGAPGLSVIAGHRDTHFRALEHLEPGARLKVERPDGSVHVYEVAHIDVVDTRRTRLRLDTPGTWLMLVTCYPFDAVTPGGPLRYTVTARKIGVEPRFPSSGPRP